jgi:hypothetical protein
MKTRADDKQANSVAICALADAHRRLTPPRIGWRTPEHAQVAACLKESLAGGIAKIFKRLGSRRALQLKIMCRIIISCIRFLVHIIGIASA